MKFKIRNDELKIKRKIFKRGDDVAFMYHDEIYTGTLIRAEKGYDTIIVRLDSDLSVRKFPLRQITSIQ
ncbi:MAG: hypothetical protein MJ244_04150 [Clostridia bacterium]|nr:hypothetical protein [Clostridia bacterium]